MSTASEPATTSRHRRRVPAAVASSAPLIAAITGLALVLRLFRLGHQSLWMDEVLTATTAALPLRAILLDPTVDVNFPPLHNVLVHLCRSALGASDAMLRLPSAIAGAASVALLYPIARRLAGRPTAVLATLLLALSPFHVWYSQEARPYALLLLLGLLTGWCAVRYLEKPASNLWLSSLVLAAAGTFYTHVIAGPVLLVLGIYALARVPPAYRLRTIGAGLLLALLVAPQVLRFVSAPPTVTANLEYRFQLMHVGYTFWAFATGYSLGPSLLELRGGMSALVPYVGLILSIVAGLAVLSLTGFVQLWRANQQGFWFLLAWVVVPVASAVLGALVTVHPYNVRYAILAAPAFLVLCAAGVVALPGPRIRVTATLIFAGIEAAALYNYYVVPKYAREDNRAAARYLNDYAPAGDVVVVSAGYTALPLRYYGLRGDLEVLQYPPAGMATAEGVSKDLAHLALTRPRLWVFLSRTFHGDPNEEIERYLGSRLTLMSDFRRSGVRVLRYEAASP